MFEQELANLSAERTVSGLIISRVIEFLYSTGLAACVDTFPGPRRSISDQCWTKSPEQLY